MDESDLDDLDRQLLALHSEQLSKEDALKDREASTDTDSSDEDEVPTRDKRKRPWEEEWAIPEPDKLCNGCIGGGLICEKCEGIIDSVGEGYTEGVCSICGGRMCGVHVAVCECVSDRSDSERD